MDVASLPFNKTLGITADGPRVLLPPKAEHLNHVNTVHAAVVYAVAEGASGHCLLQRFPEIAESFGAVLRGSTVKYRRPANPDSPLCGVGSLNEDDAISFLETLHSRGRASVEVAVSVTQKDAETFTGKFNWFAARR